jgi:hypothetical protein
MFESTIKLAGFVLAQIAWCVSEGFPLPTFAIIESRFEVRRSFVFEADSTLESVDLARQKLQRLQPFLIHWVLAYDNYISPHNEWSNEITIQLWAKDETLPSQIVQRYRRQSVLRRFKMVGKPMFLDGTGREIGDERNQQLLLDGVMEHPQVATLWDKWFQAI